MMAMPVRPLAGGRLGTPLSSVYAGQPMQGIVAGLPLHVVSSGVRYLFGVAIAGVLVVTAQVGLRGFSRLCQSLAEASQLPSAAGHLHAGRQTPDVAIAAAAAGAAGLVGVQAAWGGPGLVAGMYAYGALIALVALQTSIIVLRVADPARYRPVRAGWNLPVGKAADLPLGVLGGAACMGLLWLVVLAWDRSAGLAGSVWMLAGAGGYAVYRGRRGLGLTAHVTAARSPSAGPGMRVEYRTMLVPVCTDQHEIPADLLDVAARLCSERRASVLLLAYTRIPLGEELDMDIDDLDQSVEHLAQQARAVGDQYGIRVHTAHLRTRDPAEAILTEASRRGSDLILLEGSGLRPPLVRRPVSDQVLRRVAAEARQRVMIIQPRGVAA
jgi:Universal stress protein family